MFVEINLFKRIVEIAFKKVHCRWNFVFMNIIWWQWFSKLTFLKLKLL